MTLRSKVLLAQNVKVPNIIYTWLNLTLRSGVSSAMCVVSEEEHKQHLKAEEATCNFYHMYHV